MNNPQRIGVLGASGLTGSILIELLAKNFPEATIYPIGRRVLAEWRKWANVRPVVLPRLDMTADYEQIFQLDVLCSCLGATIAKAGSKSKFYEVDFLIPQKIFQVAKSQGLGQLILMSSIGASSQSNSFYLKTKGQLEEVVTTLGITHLHILRPSLLLGKRQDWRTMEWIAQKLLTLFNSWLPLRIRPIQAKDVALKIVELIQCPPPKVILTNREIHSKGC